MRFPCAAICVLAAAAALGCQAEYAVPQSAQAGSTVVIPLMAGGGTVIGYGGVEKDGVTPVVTDSQRGMLVYHLDSVDGFPLITRGTSAVLAAAASPKANNTVVNSFVSAGAVSQVVSVVDIPANAPVGQHALYVTRDVPGQAPIQIPLVAPISLNILPNTVSAGGVSYTAGSTPFDGINPNDNQFEDLSAATYWAVPSPQVRIQLSQPVWAAEVHILYPLGVINVVDALEPPLSRVDHLASVWFQDDEQTYASNNHGALTLNAVATQTAFQTLSFVFTLQNSATPLNPSDVIPVVTQAWDQNGNVISGVGVTSTQIF